MDLTFDNLIKHPHDAAAIWWLDNNTSKFIKFTYKETIDSAQKIKVLLEQCILKPGVIIGVIGGHHPTILPVILGIMNSTNTFCCLSSETYEATLKRQVIEVCFTLNTFDISSLHFIKTRSVDSLGFRVNLWMRPGLPSLLGANLSTFNPDCRICYCVETSGTTGEPKLVQVPIKCIRPNIENLIKAFQLCAADIIYVSSPISFDPFIVDIFLALSTGASILMTDNRMRLCRQELLHSLFPKAISDSRPPGPTFMQITPSLLSQWTLADIQNILFSANSSLKTLVLGGEEFPKMEFVAQWQDWQSLSKKRVFNIYGITEVSCWSTLYEVLGNEKEVPLGSPIDDVRVEVVGLDSRLALEEGKGELFLKSRSRKCILSSEDPTLLASDVEVVRSTGDLVELKQGGQLFYKGRLNATVKRFGVRVNLTKIEKAFDACDCIRKSCCVFEKESNKVILFYVCEVALEESAVAKQVRTLLSDHEMPDSMHAMKEFPLSSHGKISKVKLLERFKEVCQSQRQNAVDLFLKEINGLCGVELLATVVPSVSKKPRTTFESSFLQIGGTSMKALQIVTKIQDTGKISCPELMAHLLDNTKTIESLINYLRQCKEDDVTVSNQVPSSVTARIDVVFKHNLQKCIDASPTLLFANSAEPVIAVGSHSHQLVNLNLDHGEIVSKFLLEDRIESQVNQFQTHYAVVGCYAGFLYCLDVPQGSVRWRFTSNGMIKCQPLVIDETFIIFGNYNAEKNLYCLNELGHLVWSVKVGTKGILASPIQLPDSSCFVCTLDGTYACVNTDNGSTSWLKKCASPIFSNPRFMNQFSLILFAEVSGIVHCIDSTGTEIWSYSAGGNIFSGFEIVYHKMHAANIIFGCHDKNVYCLNFDKEASAAIELVWKVQFESQIYVTPRFFQTGYLIVCTTSGVVCVIDQEKGEKDAYYKAGGEIYSTPLVYGRKIYVGCRDNNLYCLKIEINLNS